MSTDPRGAAAGQRAIGAVLLVAGVVHMRP
jgi:hypothetical protein